VETSRWSGVRFEGCLDFVLRVWFLRLTASTILIFVILRRRGRSTGTGNWLSLLAFHRSARLLAYNLFPIPGTPSFSKDIHRMFVSIDISRSFREPSAHELVSVLAVTVLVWESVQALPPAQTQSQGSQTDVVEEELVVQ
jgi:hypothetical protein